MYGRTLFANNDNLRHGLYGRTHFYELLEFFRHPSAFGYTQFIDKRPFPPAGAPPSFSFFEVPTFDTAVIEFGGRSEQRLSLDDDVQWRYRLRWLRLAPAAVQTLLDFFLARHGAHQRFTLIHPLTGELRTVRFALDMAEVELYKYRLYQFRELELIEVNEPLM
jgi:hypothetical protein